MLCAHEKLGDGDDAASPCLESFNELFVSGDRELHGKVEHHAARLGVVGFGRKVEGVQTVADLAEGRGDHDGVKVWNAVNLEWRAEFKLISGHDLSFQGRLVGNFRSMLVIVHRTLLFNRQECITFILPYSLMTLTVQVLQYCACFHEYDHDATREKYAKTYYKPTREKYKCVTRKSCKRKCFRTPYGKGIE